MPISFVQKMTSLFNIARLKKLAKNCLRWWLPVFVLPFLLFIAIGFIWVPWNLESNERQRQQIADTLWMEQTMRLHLAHHEETLDALGKKIAVGRTNLEAFKRQAEVILHSNPEITSVAWYSADHQLVSTIPESAHDPAPESLSDLFGQRNFQGSTAYSPAYRSKNINADNVGESYSVDLISPFGRNTDNAGILAASINLGHLLTEVVPWWFAQNNEVQLRDATQSILAKRITAGRGRNVYTDTINLDLPGMTVYLRTDSILGKPAALPNILVVAVLVLSLILAWTLWILFLRRTKAEQQLRDQYVFRKAMEDSLVTGLRARDLEGRVTYVNPAFCRMVGYAAEELLDRTPPMPYWVPDAIEDHQHRYTQTMSGNSPPQGYESTFQHKDGERIQVQIYEAPLIDANGKHTGWMSSMLDVTERRLIEELNRQQHDRLQAGSRLAVMGELTSTLSHELNQPLMAIISYATGCLNLIERDGGNSYAIPQNLVETISKIQTQAQRTGMIIRSVHDLVKKREPRRTRCELSALIKGTLPLIELQAQKANVAIKMNLPDVEIFIDADRIMLEQVLLNLTRNAIEAIEDQPSERRRIGIVVRPVSESVEICVLDHGSPMTEEVRKQLFTPFYSTKAEGMGMGLSVCRSAVEFHGGRLEYEPNPAGGAMFRFSLRVLEFGPLINTISCQT